MSESDRETVIDKLFAASPEGKAASLITSNMRTAFVCNSAGAINIAVREKRAAKISGVEVLPVFGQQQYPNAAKRREQSSRNLHKKMIADIELINGKIDARANDGYTCAALSSDHIYHKDAIAYFTRLGFTYSNTAINWDK